MKFPIIYRSITLDESKWHNAAANTSRWDHKKDAVGASGYEIMESAGAKSLSTKQDGARYSERDKRRVNVTFPHPLDMIFAIPALGMRKG